MLKETLVVADRDEVLEPQPADHNIGTRASDGTMPVPGRSEVQTTFRGVMAQVATPVSVITALSDDHPYGTTVSAFASLSMDPPMVLVSLAKTSELLVIIRRTRRFGVNVLGSTHAGWAAAFAGKGGAGKFAGIAWSLDSGLPRLAGTSWLACRAADLVEGGDHVIVLGDVLNAQPADHRPLTYHGRGFGTHTSLGNATSEALGSRAS